MIDMWYRGADNTEECGYKAEVVSDKVESWRFLNPDQVSVRKRSSHV